MIFFWWFCSILNSAFSKNFEATLIIFLRKWYNIGSAILDFANLNFKFVECQSKTFIQKVLSKFHHILHNMPPYWILHFEFWNLSLKFVFNIVINSRRVKSAADLKALKFYSIRRFKFCHLNFTFVISDAKKIFK